MSPDNGLDGSFCWISPWPWWSVLHLDEKPDDCRNCALSPGTGSRWTRFVGENQRNAGFPHRRASSHRRAAFGIPKCFACQAAFRLSNRADNFSEFLRNYKISKITPLEQWHDLNFKICCSIVWTFLLIQMTFKYKNDASINFYTFDVLFGGTSTSIYRLHFLRRRIKRVRVSKRGPR